MTLRRIVLPLFLLLLTSAGCGEKIVDGEAVGGRDVQGAEAMLAVPLTVAERSLMLDDLGENRAAYQDLRAHLVENAVAPAVRFDPLAGLDAHALAADLDQGPPVWSEPGPLTRPADLHDLAWMTVGQLSQLVRTRQVSCVELAEFFIARLKQHDPQLHCVVTLTEQRALDQARELDARLDRGQWLGPLHGIPYGAKDLLSVAGYPTTWGAEPYRDQQLDETAAVVARLDAAGAVLVAKLTLGALAWGDVWFGGTTRNPWNLEQGSSGSSAGSASAVSAGLVPFAIGTETWGSIVSPSTRCGVTGLRPTYGRVSRRRRHGPELEHGQDRTHRPHGGGLRPGLRRHPRRRSADPGTLDLPFSYKSGFDPATVRVGYLEDAFAESGPDSALNAAALAELRARGVELIPVRFDFETLGIDPYSLAFILSAEAGAAFQELVLDGRDDLLVRQERNAWPNVFRAAQFIPAVEYIQANRQRTLLMQMMADLFEHVDVYVTPSFGGANLLVTNLTGHPQVVVPNGFVEENAPHSISFVGRLYDEATVLGLAKFYQDATGWQLRHPPEF